MRRRRHHRPGERVTVGVAALKGHPERGVLRRGEAERDRRRRVVRVGQGTEVELETADVAVDGADSHDLAGVVDVVRLLQLPSGVGRQQRIEGLHRAATDHPRFGLVALEVEQPPAPAAVAHDHVVHVHRGGGAACLAHLGEVVAGDGAVGAAQERFAVGSVEVGPTDDPTRAVDAFGRGRHRRIVAARGEQPGHGGRVGHDGGRVFEPVGTVVAHRPHDGVLIVDTGRPGVEGVTGVEVGGRQRLEREPVPGAPRSGGHPSVVDGARLYSAGVDPGGTGR